MCHRFRLIVLIRVKLGMVWLRLLAWIGLKALAWLLAAVLLLTTDSHRLCCLGGLRRRACKWRRHGCRPTHWPV